MANSVLYETIKDKLLIVMWSVCSVEVSTMIPYEIVVVTTGKEYVLTGDDAVNFMTALGEFHKPLAPGYNFSYVIPPFRPYDSWKIENFDTSGSVYGDQG